MAGAKTEAQAGEAVKPVCGIIMPIAAMPPKYDATHWSDVRKILDAAIVKAGMTPRIVSDSFESDVIQSRIISNLYENPVVVCDVSGLNPNVMFELGMRITFKQPVIIVTDDFGSIPFDTKVIEHLGYPRDLHIHQTNEFIEKLSDRIVQLNKQKEEKTFRSFIEAFGTFEVLEPTKKVVEADQLILDRLDMLDRSIGRIMEYDKRYRHEARYPRRTVSGGLKLELAPGTAESVGLKIISNVRSMFPELDVRVSKSVTGNTMITVPIDVLSEQERMVAERNILEMLPLGAASVTNIQYA